MKIKETKKCRMCSETFKVLTTATRKTCSTKCSIAYQQSPKGKARQIAYFQSPEYKAARIVCFQPRNLMNQSLNS